MEIAGGVNKLTINRCLMYTAVLMTSSSTSVLEEALDFLRPRPPGNDSRKAALSVAGNPSKIDV